MDRYDEQLLITLLFWVVVIAIIVAIRAAAVLRNRRGEAERRLRQLADLQRRAQQPPGAPAPDTAWPPGMPAGTATRQTTPVAPASPGGGRGSPVSSEPAAPAATSGLDLSASAFAPISGAQAARLAQGIGGAIWSSPWFGRRDRIPPADDPRTSVIDRAMVGQGLITPDELVEIHRIGEQMEALRPDLAQVHQAGERAVRQSREEKQQLRELKRREAAERKQRHAEGVALRRKTDIVYLGRGVSKGLAGRTADAERLSALGLPILATPADAAEALGIAVPRLRWLAFHSEATEITHYVRFTVPKRSGGVRELCAPHESLRVAQEWILERVLEKVPAHPAAHGFVPGRSTVTNATPHVGAGVVVNTDLVDFFPTITFPRVLGIFRQLGYSSAVSTIFALLCTEAPRRRVTYAGRPLWVATGPRALPQGACTSPALSNLAARRMDSRLAGIASKLGFQYTRYADDLTFSAAVDDGKVGYVLARVRQIAQDEGFAVNERKTRVQRQSARQTVTGIVVNTRPGVPRKTVRRLRAILHRAKTGGLTAQNREKHPHFEAWVRGMTAYVRMVNPQQGAGLHTALDALD